MDKPIRLCCGKAHDGAVCPDSKVMCCLCFERVTMDQLSTMSGKKQDICLKCKELDAA